MEKVYILPNGRLDLGFHGISMGLGLTSLNDFRLWKVRMKALLEQQQLAVALEELPASMIVTYDNVIQEKVFSALILCLGDRVLREITKKTTATGILKKLEILYMTKSLANNFYLKKKFYTFNMHPGKSQSEPIDEFHKLVGELAAIDTAILDEEYALTFHIF
nr:retrovirus-related Pol polyprotein from transposon TNT 1-94 [Tanacetum cinerariifolium]